MYIVRNSCNRVALPMLMFACFFAVGCAAGHAPEGAEKVAPPAVVGSAAHCPVQRLFRLYFGSATPDGTVSERDWQRFVDHAIVPNFASGFTVLRADGQWLGNNGKRVTEATKIVEVVADSAQYPVIQAIAARYKKQFRQDAVLVLSSDVGACLE